MIGRDIQLLDSTFEDMELNIPAGRRTWFRVGPGRVGLAAIPDVDGHYDGAAVRLRTAKDAPAGAVEFQASAGQWLHPSSVELTTQTHSVVLIGPDGRRVREAPVTLFTNTPESLFALQRTGTYRLIVLNQTNRKIRGTRVSRSMARARLGPWFVMASRQPSSPKEKSVGPSCQ